MAQDVIAADNKQNENTKDEGGFSAAAAVV